MKLEGGKRINTENISSNGTEIRRINTKKPKILKNSIRVIVIYFEVIFMERYFTILLNNILIN